MITKCVCDCVCGCVLCLMGVRMTDVIAICLPSPIHQPSLAWPLSARASLRGVPLSRCPLMKGAYMCVTSQTFGSALGVLLQCSMMCGSTKCMWYLAFLGLQASLHQQNTEVWLNPPLWIVTYCSEESSAIVSTFINYCKAHTHLKWLHCVSLSWGFIWRT